MTAAPRPSSRPTPPQTPPATPDLAGPYGASFTGEGTRGLTFERRWTRPDVHPYDEITWEYRTAGIANESGKTVFEQKDVEVPDFWSQLATNVVVSKYFRGHLNTPERETSVRQLIDRVVNTITAWAETQHYFATDADLADVQGRADAPARPPEDGVQLAGLVQRRDRSSSRSAAPASSTRSRTRCPRSWTSPRPRRCCSSSARARAATSRTIRSLQGEDGRRRHRLGPRLLHEGL